MRLLLDAGPIFAYLSADDPDHESSVALLESFEGELVIPQLVLAEVSYFVNTRVKRAVGAKLAAETELALIETSERAHSGRSPSPTRTGRTSPSSSAGIGTSRWARPTLQ